MNVDVAVIGAGPAGATVATRLTQLGHRVAIVDRGRRRSHRVETLAPVTLELLALSGADEPVRRAGFPTVESMTVEWDTPRHDRPMPAGSCLVDRDRFDALLVDHAARCGVAVLRPVHVTGRHRVAPGWAIEGDDAPPVNARFLVDATGRPSTLRRSRPDALLAITGRWDGASPDRPAIVALDHGWVWAAPGSCCDVTAFVDPVAWRTQGGEPVDRYTRLVAAADVLPADARLVGGVSAADASGATGAMCGRDWLAVGDAALALDPLSSSGVQRAVQGALTAAIVINTVLGSPADAALALEHYGQMITRAAAHHADWTRESYAAVAAARPTAFWKARADPVDRPAPRLPAGDERGDTRSLPAPGTLVRRSPSVRFVQVSQVVGNTVQLAPAVEHPALDGAVAFVGGIAVVPLLSDLDRATAIGELVTTWATRMPPASAADLAAWLLRAGVLEEVA